MFWYSLFLLKIVYYDKLKEWTRTINFFSIVSLILGNRPFNLFRISELKARHLQLV